MSKSRATISLSLILLGFSGSIYPHVSGSVTITLFTYCFDVTKLDTSSGITLRITLQYTVLR